MLVLHLRARIQKELGMQVCSPSPQSSAARSCRAAASASNGQALHKEASLAQAPIAKASLSFSWESSAGGQESSIDPGVHGHRNWRAPHFK